MRPTLIIVSGHPGSGKTTLAHALARSIPCPAVCRDEIKEGLVHARAAGRPALGDRLSRETYDIFFDVVRLLVERGVTHVAEAAFRHELWAPRLESFLPGARMRVIRCAVDPEIARHRIEVRRGDPVRQRAHPDDDFLAALERGECSFEDYEALDLAVPTLTVDTTDGYEPMLGEIVAFAR